MYEQVIDELRHADNISAKQREEADIADWKVIERQKFLEMLQQEGKESLLEIGAGPGKDSLFFQEQGMKVIATDLSPEMVNLCREKGLTAYAMDFLGLDFPDDSFDAIYSRNCLLHVPTSALASVLEKLQKLLAPRGLFYLGVYGGNEYEGTWPDDKHQPKRFFSYHCDDFMHQAVSVYFDVLYFEPISLKPEDTFHFQSMMLRRR